jgi:undecaprenyl-diphosphatase
MLDKLIELDKSVFFDLNGLHSPAFDTIMVFMSASKVWIPLYIVILSALFFKLGKRVKGAGIASFFSIKRLNFRYSLIILLAVLLTFALTDSLSSEIKDIVKRFRPGYDPITGNLVRLLEYPGSMYGFLSSHAANTFGLALITSLRFRNRLYTCFIFFWAFLVSYSRIYVGKHYPLDVLCGAMLGMLLALLVYYLMKIAICKFKLKAESDVIYS